MLKRSKFTLEDGLRRLLRQPPTPQAGNIRWKAHAATLATAALIVPSACAVYFHRVAERENEPYWAITAERLWKIHAAIAIIAVVLWIFEKPRKVGYVSDHTPVKRRGASADPEAAALHRRANLQQAYFFLPLVSLFCLGIAYQQTIEIGDAWRLGRTMNVVMGGVAVLLLLAFALGAGFLLYLLLRKPRPK